MRGTRRAVIALVWLLGTGAATAITIEGVRVVGSKVINGESAISPRQANAALNGRTTTTVEVPVNTEAVTTTVTTELPTTVATDAPTTEPVTEAVTTAVTTARAATPTTRKKTVVSAPITAKPTTSPPPTSPPTVTTKPAPPPTTPPATSSPPTTARPTTTAPSPCIQQARVTEGGYVTACFTAQKVSVLIVVAFKDWSPAQLSSGARPVVQFTKDDHTITVTAFWNSGPAWTVQESH